MLDSTLKEDVGSGTEAVAVAQGPRDSHSGAVWGVCWGDFDFDCAVDTALQYPRYPCPGKSFSNQTSVALSVQKIENSF